MIKLTEKYKSVKNVKADLMRKIKITFIYDRNVRLVLNSKNEIEYVKSGYCKPDPANGHKISFFPKDWN